MKKSFWIFLLLLPLLLVGCSEKQNAVAATVSGQMNYSEQTIAAVQKLTDGNTAAFYQLFDDNMKKEMSEQDLQALQNKLATEMASENAKNSQILRDSINAFLKEYNKTKGYNLIISNTSFDNLLYADSTLNITKEIVDGLNARYTPVAKK